MVPNGIMTYEFERMRKEAIMTKLRYSPGTYLEGLMKTTKKSVRIVSVLAKIRTS
jgi:hypothetical protein